VRKRLEALLSKSEKMEDTIKLEQELERVTQTIELIKGKLQYMQDQIAFSTIRVDLNSPRPQAASGTIAALPFSLAALGLAAGMGLTIMYAGQTGFAFSGMIVQDGFSSFLQVLFLATGLLGVALAYGGLRALIAAAPIDLPRLKASS